MKYLYYTGCVIPYRAPNYDLSSRRVLEHLGVELVDMPEAGCCGIYVRQVDELKSYVLAARIWSMAEAEELDILSPCPGCVSTLIHARDHLCSEQELLERVNDILAPAGRTFRGTQNAKHLLRVLHEDVGLEAIAAAVEQPIAAQFAAHYGCHLVRPEEELGFDDSETPVILDELIEATGASSLEYPEKMGCCGMNVHGNDPLRGQMAGRKLHDGKTAGAEAFVLGCPACYLAMGLNQRLAELDWEEGASMPVILLPQLLGLALGIEADELGLNLNRPRMDTAALSMHPNGRQPS